MSEYYDYTKPVIRQRRHAAVESNAARSPSALGQHPHVVGDDRNHNPQGMYEGNGGQPARPYRQLGQVQPPPPSDDGFWGKLLLLAGVGALAYMVGKSSGEDEDELDEFVEVRQNPAPALPPPQPTVVVVPPAGISVTAQQPAPQPVQQPQPQLLPQPVIVPQPQHPVIDIPQPIASGGVDVGGVAVLQTPETVEVQDAVVVEDDKPKRTRKTTQARDEDGKFMPAGTLKRAVVEGKD